MHSKIAPRSLQVVGFAFALALVGGRASAATVALSVADGAKLSDTVVITARVTGFEQTGVRRVEFLVDGKVRSEDTSIPYTFEWNTLDDAEGEHNVEAVATDMNGDVAKGSARVVVDNELGKGADYHGRIALEALAAKDTETARRHALRAVKIDPTNLTAARALAAIHTNAREYDQAVAVLEQANIPEKDVLARRDLMSLYVLRGDAGGNTQSFLQGVTSAYEQWKLLTQARAAVAANGTPVEKGDAAFAARKWQAAIMAYQSAGELADMPIGTVNRLLLSYARAGRWRDCDLLLRTLSRDERGDDVTQAVRGFYLLQTHKPTEARQVVQRGVDARVLPSLIVAACADLILNERKRAEEEITAAASMAPDDPSVAYLQAMVTTDPLEARRLLARAIATDPSNPELLVRKAYDILSGKQPNKQEEAEAVLELARKLDPDNPDVLLATASLLMLRKRAEEAQPLLEKLLAQDKDAPDVLVGQALNFSLLDRSREITDLLNRAMKIDEDRWNDVFVPKPLDYVNRVMRYRITPILTPKTLYPHE